MKTTKSEITKGISPEVLPRLERAITQLLNAGWTIGAVRDALSKNQSFGKYDGCTPTAILELARLMCAEMNAEGRKIEQEIYQRTTASLREEFPDMAKYFTANFVKGGQL